MTRIAATADLAFFISASGSDSTGDGSAGNPWATAPHAYQFVQQNYDLLGQFKTTVTMQTGFTNVAWFFEGPLVGALGAKSFSIVGQVGSPGSIALVGTNARAAFTIGGDVRLTCTDFALNPGAGGTCFTVGGGAIDVHDVWFAQNGGASIFDAAGPSSSISASGGFQLWASGPALNIFAVSEDNAQINLSGAMAFEYGPTCSTAFVQGDVGGVVDLTGFTYSGNVSGRQFVASQGGCIHYGGSPIPGTISGDATTGYFSP